MARLELARVSRRFGATVALRELDLTADDGELLVVVGPSGCGKTTALRIAAGLDSPDSGTIRIGERDVTRIDPARRNVSMVFQGQALFPHLSVAENIGFGLAARGVDRGIAAGRVREAAETVGCADLLDRRPGQLSGGEGQRVALARAIVREPDVFLLDEPLSNLDAQLRVQMRGEIRALQRRLGTTMVHVTHDQVEALTLGDRVAVLRNGELQQVGPPDDVYRRPANRFVATFVGSPAMNLAAAELTAGHLTAGPFRIPAPSGLDGARLADRALEVGLRPEALELLGGPAGASARPPAAPTVSAAAEVVAVEPAGNETFIHLDAGGLRLIVRAGPDARPSLGSVVAVGIAREATVHLFDRDSGVALG